MRFQKYFDRALPRCLFIQLKAISPTTTHKHTHSWPRGHQVQTVNFYGIRTDLNLAACHNNSGSRRLGFLAKDSFLCLPPATRSSTHSTIRLPPALPPIFPGVSTNLRPQTATPPVSTNERAGELSRQVINELPSPQIGCNTFRSSMFYAASTDSVVD